MKHKFNAVRTQRDGKKFPSKLEAKYYDQLKLRQKAGDVLFFLRQVPFDLADKLKYLVDYMIFLSSGEIEFIDVKGMDTQVSLAKRKMVESLYPITIKLITKQDLWS